MGPTVTQDSASCFRKIRNKILNSTKSHLLSVCSVTLNAVCVLQQWENCQLVSSLFYSKISRKCSTKSLHSLGSLSTNYGQPNVKPAVPAQLSVLSWHHPLYCWRLYSSVPVQGRSSYSPVSSKPHKCKAGDNWVDRKCLSSTGQKP